MKAVALVSMSLLFPLISAAAEIPHAKDFEPAAWSPYLVGALLGVLTWLTFYFSDQAVGASSFYATLAGKLGLLIAPKRTRSLPYFKDNPPRFGWGDVFVMMTILGAFVAAQTGCEFTNRWMPPMWTACFGEDSLAWRGLAAFGGGVLMAFGARLAGGCTSGHGISGTLQLNVASWIAVIFFFIGGVALANVIYRL